MKGLPHREVTILRSAYVSMQLRFLSFHYGVSEDFDLTPRQNGCPPNDQFTHELSMEGINSLVIRTNYDLVHYRCEGPKRVDHTDVFCPRCVV